jgi:drug/metabolite transporter (DMT)-like permease
VVKFALEDFGALAFAAARFAVATGLLAAYVRVTGESVAVAPADRAAVIRLGLVGHAGYQLCFVVGLQRTATTHSALILALVPVFVALLGRFRGGERLGKAGWAGVLASFGGIVLVVAGGDRGTGATLAGDALILVGALAWAIYTVLGRPLLARYSAPRLTAATMVPGSVVLLVVGAPAILREPWRAVSLEAWFAFAYAAVAGLVIAYVIWFAAVQALGGARTAVYSNLVPVVALAVGALFLGERMSALQLAGALLVVFGIWLTRRPLQGNQA